MEKNRRNSDLSADIYLSLYGNNRNLSPERIKSYAIYKNVSESSMIVNCATADSNNNEVLVCFNGTADSKVFTFDKVFHSDIQQSELSLTLIKSSVQDVIMGLNSYLIICKLASSHSTNSFEREVPNFEKQCSIDRFPHSLIAELLSYAKNEENMDSSLHVSYYEIHDDKVFDLLGDNHDYMSTKVFEFIEQNWIELKDLTVKPIVDEKNILEFLGRKLPHSLVCNASCCHSVISVSLIRKNVNDEGFECIKTGTLNLVSFANCKNSNLEDIISDDCLLKFSEEYSESVSTKGKIWDILRPAFKGNAKTSIVLLLSSVLYSLKNDLSVLQFVSEIRKTLTQPEMIMRLVIPDSLKEYAEKIKELQRDLNATIKGEGIMLNNMIHRYYRNSVSLENEKVKILMSQLLHMTDVVKSKEQQLINSRAMNETLENEINETEKTRESLMSELRRIKNENAAVKQRTSRKADEIIRMKEQTFPLELSRNKLKLELLKINGNDKELTHNLHGLKDEMNSLLLDIDADQTSLNSTLELLLVDMNGTLLDFQSLEDASLKILNNLSDTCDGLVTKWKQSTNLLLFKLTSFIDENHKKLTAFKTAMNTPSESHLASHNGILNIIKSTRNEKWSNLSYYFGKVHFFCQSSFKILAGIMDQLDVIQRCFKAEIKAIGEALSSSSQALKKFINDSNTTLMSFRYDFEVQKKELLNMSDIICLHHKFKKEFDKKLADFKQGMLALKDMCLKHNDVAVHKWNELHNGFEESMKRHLNMSDHLFVFNKEVSKYSNNLAQQTQTSTECSPIRNEINYLEHRSHQLVQIQKEVKNNIVEAFDVHKEAMDKELLEVNKYVENQKTEIEKYYEDNILKIKTNVKQFYNELSCLQQVFFTAKSERNKILDSLLSTTSNISTVYNSYKSVSNSILEKIERSFQIMPPVIESKNDNMPDIECLVLDDCDIVTSTPNIALKKENSCFSYEKEKLLCRVKSIAEQQILQKERESDKKEKCVNTSTVSLPNISTFSKVPTMKGKSFSRMKFSKKH